MIYLTKVEPSWQPSWQLVAGSWVAGTWYIDLAGTGTGTGTSSWYWYWCWQRSFQTSTPSQVDVLTWLCVQCSIIVIDLITDAEKEAYACKYKHKARSSQVSVLGISNKNSTRRIPKRILIVRKNTPFRKRRISLRRKKATLQSLMVLRNKRPYFVFRRLSVYLPTTQILQIYMVNVIVSSAQVSCQLTVS